MLYIQLRSGMAVAMPSMPVMLPVDTNSYSLSDLTFCGMGF